MDAEELARRSVDPSMLSLLGLVRHMADVEHYWFRQMMAGEDSPAPFHSAADPDEEFYAAQPDADAVEDDWQAWRREAASRNRPSSRPIVWTSRGTIAGGYSPKTSGPHRKGGGRSREGC
ncbi:mycothiol transferase [Arthrobacter sp. RHLT1-20]